MKSPHYFLVEPLNGKRYDNTKKVGDKELTLSVSLEHAKETQRHAIVTALPINYNGPVKDDAIVLVHHNIFRRHYNMQGKEVSTASHFKDQTFIVEPGHVFLYKNDWAQDWESLDPYIFIEPLESDGKDLTDHMLKEFWGKVRFSNSTINDMGLYDGDIVSYKPETEYEFRIEDKVYYRMYIRDICLKK